MREEWEAYTGPRGQSLQVNAATAFSSCSTRRPIQSSPQRREDPSSDCKKHCVRGIFGSVTAQTKEGKSSGRTSAMGKACRSVLPYISLLCPACLSLSQEACMKKEEAGECRSAQPGWHPAYPMKQGTGEKSGR